MDIFPTIGEIVGLDKSVYVQPLDGTSLVSVFDGYAGSRESPIPFKRLEGVALIDNQWKIVAPNVETGQFELYDLVQDP
ncbi:MAG: N-acetylgalactosamine 6-sulfate sulfatase, partial [Verrucomicrobiia bacterium]